MMAPRIDVVGTTKAQGRKPSGLWVSGQAMVKGHINGFAQSFAWEQVWHESTQSPEHASQKVSS